MRDNCCEVRPVICVCRLFSVDADVEAELVISYTFKLPTSSSDIELGVGLMVDRPRTQLWLVGDESSDYSSLCGSDVSCRRYAQQQTTGTWITRFVTNYWHLDHQVCDKLLVFGSPGL